MERYDKTVILAAGGTGGHIFPALSLAAELRGRGYKVILVTDKRSERFVPDTPELAVRTIYTSPVGGSLFSKVRAAIRIGFGMLQARKMLKQVQPAAVIGFGGYPSFPTMMSAVRLGVPTIIHEQNSLLGRVNYLLSGKVDAIATSFEDTTGILERDIAKTTLTGNPVRPNVKVIREMEYPELQENGTLKLLVIGGSQGASVFSEVVPEALAQLPEERRRRIRVDQQCRPEDIEQVRARYEKLSVSADLAEFFSNIPSRFASAHLVICRAGASTLSELMVAGRPAILVPFPAAKDDHQTVNANAMEDAGGGWLLPQDSFTPDVLAKRLDSLLTLPSKLKETAKKSWSAGKVDADKRLGDVVEKVIFAAAPKVEVAEVSKKDIPEDDVTEEKVDESVLDSMESRG